MNMSLSPNTTLPVSSRKNSNARKKSSQFNLSQHSSPSRKSPSPMPASIKIAHIAETDLDSVASVSLLP